MRQVIPVNRLLRLISIFFISCQLLQGCSKIRVVNTEERDIRTFSVGELDTSRGILFDHLIKDIKYLRLSSKVHINQINRIHCSSALIYILDDRNWLYIFDSNGNMIRKLENISTFDLFGETLYTYNPESGNLSTYSRSGKYKAKKHLGFRGIDFALVNDTTIAFYTAGLVTDDRQSTDFELTFVSLEGELLSYAFRLNEIKKGVNYAVKNRFKRSSVGLTFTPTFNSKIYKINENNISGLLKFSFGRQTITDQEFRQFNKIENYNFFPFVLGLENRVYTNQAAFFSFTYKGKEGYILVDVKTEKIISKGIGYFSALNTVYNDIIPQTQRGEEFVSVVSPEDFSNNFRRHIRPGTRDIPPIFPGLKASTILNNTNPVLMFFTLKND